MLDQAVDRCLSTGPTGIFLSGGLDSISVAAVAAGRARQLSRPAPIAFSLGFPHPSCDERAIQSKLNFLNLFCTVQTTYVRPEEWALAIKKRF